MVPEKYQLEAVGQFLLASFERRRPGLTAWTKELEGELFAEAEAELVQMEKQCKELGIDDAPYWKKVRGALQSVLMPRYAALVKDELVLQRAGYHLWRNGDLVARMAFAGAGLVLGAAAVAIPWIPVTEKWVPWMLFAFGPFLPDAQLWFYKKRYERKLNHLVQDLGRAGRSLDTYRSISEMQQALGEPGPIEAPVQTASQAALPSAMTSPMMEAPAQPLANAPDENLAAPSRLKH